jgi:hypothetical protein
MTIYSHKIIIQIEKESTGSPSPSASVSPSVSPSPSPGYEGYTRGDYSALPSDDTDLETNYSSQDYIDVDAKDTVRVTQQATDEYAIHQFKDFISGNSVTVSCNLQSDIACSQSTIYLQIYNRDLSTWETMDSDSTTSANTDLDLEGTKTDLTDYKDAQGLISCRVYQLAQ